MIIEIVNFLKNKDKKNVFLNSRGKYEMSPVKFKHLLEIAKELENRLLYSEEELECLDMYLDKIGAPEKVPCHQEGYQDKLRKLSRIGRIKKYFNV